MRQCVQIEDLKTRQCVQIVVLQMCQWLQQKQSGAIDGSGGPQSGHIEVEILVLHVAKKESMSPD